MNVNDNLVDIGESRLDSLIAAEANADDTPPEDDTSTPPTDDQGDDVTPPSNDDDNNQDDTGDEEASGDEDDDQSDDDKGDQGDQGDDEDSDKELTDEELIELAKKRGLELGKKKDEEPAKEIRRPNELPEDIWSDMRPEQKYIYNQLPYITVRGKDGDIKVKTDQQLPDDFEFKDSKAEASFNSEVAAQSVRAEKMYDQITNYSKQQQEQATRQQEAAQTVSDIEKLQKEGIMPKIKAKPNSQDFMQDPAVKLADEIIAYRQKLLGEGQRISAYYAGLQYKALHPDKFEIKKPVTKSKADDERKAKAKNIAGNGRGAAVDAKNKGNQPERPRFKANTSLMDIADHYSDELDG